MMDKEETLGQMLQAKQIKKQMDRKPGRNHPWGFKQQSKKRKVKK